MTCSFLLGPRRESARHHASPGTHDDAPGHIRMYRAIVFVGARLIEPTAKACSRQQKIRTLYAVMVLQPMRRTIVIDPGDALTGSYRDLSRRESKVNYRYLGAIIDCDGSSSLTE